MDGQSYTTLRNASIGRRKRSFWKRAIKTASLRNIVKSVGHDDRRLSMGITKARKNCLRRW